jgi:hypothetical protein
MQLSVFMFLLAEKSGRVTLCNFISSDRAGLICRVEADGRGICRVPVIRKNATLWLYVSASGEKWKSDVVQFYFQ